jgi:hypothetical protein
LHVQDNLTLHLLDVHQYNLGRTTSDSRSKERKQAAMVMQQSFHTPRMTTCCMSFASMTRPSGGGSNWGARLTLIAR